MQNVKDTKTFVTNNDEEIKKILITEKYDAIFVTLDYLFVSRLKRLGYEGKIIYDVQGFGTDIKELLESAKPHIERQVDGILSPKTPHLQNLIAHYFPMEKKFSFHNCIHFPSFKYRKLPKHSNKIIGWVGRIDNNKNWKLFLQLCAKLIQVDPCLEFWLFVDPLTSTPIQKDRFKKWVKQLGLNNNLKSFFNVPNEEMMDYYSIIGDSGGFLCSTSKKEGFGYAVIEAMCCSCPVICTDSDGIKSFVLHNQTGKIIPKDDLVRAVEEVMELLNNQSLRKKITGTALNHIQENFDPSSYRVNFWRIFKSIGLVHQ